MSKTQSEKELEKELEIMAKSRDHWRKKASQYEERIAALEHQRDQLQNENRELQDELELGEADRQILGVDAIKSYRELAQRFQRERREASNDAAKFANSLFAFMLDVQTEAQENEKMLSAKAEQFNKAVEQQPIPQIADLLGRIYAHLETRATGEYNTLLKQIRQYTSDNSIDVADSPYECMMLAGRLMYIKGVQKFAGATIWAAYGFSHHPVVIADEIIRQCQTSKDRSPNMETLQRLSQTWIDENLSPGLRHETLRNGLHWVQKFYDEEGVTVKEFCERYASYGCLQERKFYTSKGYYDKLETIRRETPAELIALVEQELNAKYDD